MLGEDELRAAWDRLWPWLETALTRWPELAQGPDGGWVEHLNLDATPDYDAIRRHRVQARQVFTYAFATYCGWIDGRDVMRRTLAFMNQTGWRGDSYIHRLNPDGSVNDDRRDLYDHAFYLLALAWAQRVDPKVSTLRRIAEVRTFMDEIALPSGGWAEGRDHDGRRRQNPHMHLLEVGLALHGADLPGIEIAEESIRLLRAHFIGPDDGILEHFDAGWNWDGGPFEPGHGCEWVWLLKKWDVATGENTSELRARIYAKATAWPGQFLPDALTPEGETVRDTYRLWVQTELVRAHIGQENYRAAAEVLDALMGPYLMPGGVWTDQLGACRQRVSETIPTSTFYHIASMAGAIEAALT